MSNHGNDAVIVSIARTAVGRGRKGALTETRAEDLGRTVLQAVMDRAPGFSAAELDDVVIGCAMPEGEQGLNFARIMSLYAGYPVTVPAITVNRFCSSGLQAIAQASERIMLGFASAIVAGGVESMSHVPMTGFMLSPHPGIVQEMPEVYIGMGHTAENVSRLYGITREDQDRFAYASHEKAAAAIQAGKFLQEIVPVRTSRIQSDGSQAMSEQMFQVDECVRVDTSMEALGKLTPSFMANGTVTAGNSSPISDGAAAVLIMSRAEAERRGLQPMAVFRAFALAGVEPEVMGIGPIEAIPRAIKMAGLKLTDIDLFEINEAFASQCVAIIRELALPEDRVNVNGGAIALGHPLGCTGTKLSISLIQELRRRGGGYGVVSMCIGGGMGAAGVFEVYP